MIRRMERDVFLTDIASPHLVAVEVARLARCDRRCAEWCQTTAPAYRAAHDWLMAARAALTRYVCALWVLLAPSMHHFGSPSALCVLRRSDGIITAMERTGDDDYDGLCYGGIALITPRSSDDDHPHGRFNMSALDAEVARIQRSLAADGSSSVLEWIITIIDEQDQRARVQHHGAVVLSMTRWAREDAALMSCTARLVGAACGGAALRSTLVHAVVEHSYVEIGAASFDFRPVSHAWAQDPAALDSFCATYDLHPLMAIADDVDRCAQLLVTACGGVDRAALIVDRRASLTLAEWTVIGGGAAAVNRTNPSQSSASPTAAP